MLARCFCPKHGKLEFDDIYIDHGKPICRKCRSVLEFGKIKPRYIEKPTKKRKRRKRRKTKRKKR